MKPTIPHNMPDQVLACIRRYTDADRRVSKRMIAEYLNLPYANTHSDTVDRNIRAAVAELRERGEPICSTAGRAGYWYSYADLGATIADLKSRGNEMFSTARTLERAQAERGLESDNWSWCDRPRNH